MSDRLSSTDVVSTPSRGPLTLLLNLFSSIWLGITLLTLLFIYSSLGSAVPPLRQLRVFDMTEFEWFHWWPFDLLIALICINLVVATLRRIPLTILTLGVWMIHGGIIILCLASVWYFSTKIEGDTPVIRRQVRITTADGSTGALPVVPGTITTVGAGPGRVSLQVVDVDPNWVLPAGSRSGTAMRVLVDIQTAQGGFMRQLVAGHPDLSEDIVSTGDPNRPRARAINVVGTPLVDPTLRLELQYESQDWVYLMDSRALYIRKVGTTAWHERPIHGLPRYHDRVASSDDVWADGAAPLPRPLRIEIPPAGVDDPAPGVTFGVSGYLRYATMQSQYQRGDAQSAPLNPIVDLTLSAPMMTRPYQLAAFDPVSRTAEGGALEFRWVNSIAERERALVRRAPELQIAVPEAGVDVVVPVELLTGGAPEAPFVPVPGADYEYRVESLQDAMEVQPGQFVWLAIVEFRRGDTRFRRWVFSEPSLNRDFPVDAPGGDMHGAAAAPDEGLVTTYRPGNQPAMVTVIAGPTDADLGIAAGTPDGGDAVWTDATIGTPVPVGGNAALTVTINRFAAYTREITRPLIVPVEQRNKDVGVQLSMIQVQVPTSSGTTSTWLNYNHYAFEDANHNLRRYAFRPRVVRLPDGTQYELLFSRERLPLPAPVALDDFRVTSHVGGFTGEISSIRDWTSMVTFETDRGWTPPVPVSMNAPATHKGFSFFQAQWDPPDEPRFEGDPGSRGLNYTVLGVGNRNGVVLQLVGCCIAVFGMFWAFYVKPIIKRRRQQRVYASVRAGGGASGRGANGMLDAPVAGRALRSASVEDEA
ncbi:MAG: hypothetical protein KDA25_02440 [Phycisphaerales bacterium]|nr:hypothetical protein [Phycisphaerales bacterium]